MGRWSYALSVLLLLPTSHAFVPSSLSCRTRSCFFLGTYADSLSGNHPQPEGEDIPDWIQRMAADYVSKADDIEKQNHDVLSADPPPRHDIEINGGTAIISEEDKGNKVPVMPEIDPNLPEWVQMAMAEDAQMSVISGEDDPPLTVEYTPPPAPAPVPIPVMREDDEDEDIPEPPKVEAEYKVPEWAHKAGDAMYNRWNQLHRNGTGGGGRNLPKTPTIQHDEPRLLRDEDEPIHPNVVPARKHWAESQSPYRPENGKDYHVVPEEWMPHEAHRTPEPRQNQERFSSTQAQRSIPPDAPKIDRSDFITQPKQSRVPTTLWRDPSRVDHSVYARGIQSQQQAHDPRFDGAYHSQPPQPPMQPPMQPPRPPEMPSGLSADLPMCDQKEHINGPPTTAKRYRPTMPVSLTPDAPKMGDNLSAQQIYQQYTRAPPPQQFQQQQFYQQQQYHQQQQYQQQRLQEEQEWIPEFPPDPQMYGVVYEPQDVAGPEYGIPHTVQTPRFGDGLQIAASLRPDPPLCDVPEHLLQRPPARERKLPMSLSADAPRLDVPTVKPPPPVRHKLPVSLSPDAPSFDDTIDTPKSPPPKHHNLASSLPADPPKFDASQAPPQQRVQHVYGQVDVPDDELAAALDLMKLMAEDGRFQQMSFEQRVAYAANAVRQRIASHEARNGRRGEPRYLPGNDDASDDEVSAALDFFMQKMANNAEFQRLPFDQRVAYAAAAVRRGSSVPTGLMQPNHVMDRRRLSASPQPEAFVVDTNEHTGPPPHITRQNEKKASSLKPDDPLEGRTGQALLTPRMPDNTGQDSLVPHTPLDEKEKQEEVAAALKLFMEKMADNEEFRQMSTEERVAAAVASVRMSKNVNPFPQVVEKAEPDALTPEFGAESPIYGAETFWREPPQKKETAKPENPSKLDEAAKANAVAINGTPEPKSPSSNDATAKSHKQTNSIETKGMASRISKFLKKRHDDDMKGGMKDVAP